jgi:hypothetical protein
VENAQNLPKNDGEFFRYNKIIQYYLYASKILINIPYDFHKELEKKPRYDPLANKLPSSNSVLIIWALYKHVRIFPKSDPLMVSNLVGNQKMANLIQGSIFKGNQT